jgi:hypothetical protein
MRKDPKSIKKLSVLFHFFGSGQAKYASRVLMKLTPVINFINNLGAAFAPIYSDKRIILSKRIVLVKLSS